MALYIVDRQIIDSKAGALFQQLDATFLRIQQFKIFLDTISDANLISLYGFVQADLDILRSSLSDAEQLRGLYQGASTLGVAKDFRTFAKQVYAFGSF